MAATTGRKMGWLGSIWAIYSDISVGRVVGFRKYRLFIQLFVVAHHRRSGNFFPNLREAILVSLFMPDRGNEWIIC
jgi:hypothetical protein